MSPHVAVDSDPSPPTSTHPFLTQTGWTPQVTAWRRVCGRALFPRTQYAGLEAEWCRAISLPPFSIHRWAIAGHLLTAPRPARGTACTGPWQQHSPTTLVQYTTTCTGVKAGNSSPLHCAIHLSVPPPHPQYSRRTSSSQYMTRGPGFPVCNLKRSPREL